jgi:hypothetical protein
MRTFLPVLAASIAALAAGGCGGTTNQPAGTGATGGGSGASGGESSGGSGGDTTGSTNSDPPSDVTGSLVDTYLAKGGDVKKAPDPATIQLAALIPRPGGSFDTIEAVVSADGTFKIPQVPPQGPYYLKYGDGSYLVTTKRTLDLGSRIVGRPDVASATQISVVTMDATGLSPWGDLDTLEIYSGGTATYGDLSSVAQPVPMPGDTALQGFSFDMEQLDNPVLIDGGKGDMAFFTQLVTHKAGAVEYQTIGAVFSPAAFTQINGQSTKLSGAFQPVAPAPASIDFKRSAFGALAAQVNPAAKAVSFDVFAYAEPGGLTEATISWVPTVLSYSDTDGADAKLDLGYGDPFPATWGVVTTASATFAAHLVPPGQMTPRSLFGTVVVSALIDDLAKGPAVPLVGPPQKVQINGKDASGVLAGVGATLTVSWSPPVLGKAAVYRIAVRQLNPAPPATTTALFLTTDTQITLPDGILQPGEGYYLRVSALSDFDADRPFRFKNAGASADAVTGPFTP